MYLYEGLPVIATKTHRKLNMFNNEMYLVESYNPFKAKSDSEAITESFEQKQNE